MIPELEINEDPTLLTTTRYYDKLNPDQGEYLAGKPDYQVDRRFKAHATLEDQAQWDNSSEGQSNGVRDQS